MALILWIKVTVNVTDRFLKFDIWLKKLKLAFLISHQLLDSLRGPVLSGFDDVEGRSVGSLGRHRFLVDGWRPDGVELRRRRRRRLRWRRRPVRRRRSHRWSRFGLDAVEGRVARRRASLCHPLEPMSCHLLWSRLPLGHFRGRTTELLAPDRSILDISSDGDGHAVARGSAKVQPLRSPDKKKILFDKR